MSIYTVHIPGDAASPQEETAAAVFVAEGFNKTAFVFAPFWCIFRRSWLGLALWFVAMASIWLAVRYIEIAAPAGYAAALALHVLFGFEAAQLRRRSLSRRDYDLADVVSADSAQDARLTFELRRSEPGADAPSSPVSGVATRVRPVSSSDSYGLAPLGGGA